MKHTYSILITLSLAVSASSQNWDMHLNNVSPPSNPNFGTSSDQPINFYTNGIQRMTLSTSGILNINGMAGENSRFLHVDSNGDLIPWSGDGMYANSILFGDGSWRPNLIRTDGNNMFTDPGVRFGIGVGTPTSEIHVSGNGEISDNLAVGSHILLGTPSENSSINFIPGTGTDPSILNFKIGNINEWMGGGGGPPTGEDPLPDISCTKSSLNPPTIAAVFPEFLCVHKPILNSSPPASYGNINLGHDGTKGFIETEGGHPTLHINAKCNKNVYVFSDGSATFASAFDHVMSIAGQLCVKQNMQIGTGTGANTFVYNTGPGNTQLYVAANTKDVGLRVRGGITGILAIALNNTDKPLSVYKGSASSDGTERFSVLGDGKTTISSTNPDAFLITDANTTKLTFKIDNLGNTFIGEGANTFSTDKLVVAHNNSNAKVLSLVDNTNLLAIKALFNVWGDGHTDIKSSYSGAALSIYNSLTNNETFKIHKDGYTEIKVYSPLGMPIISGATNPRVFSIRDMSGATGRDLFLVRSDGVVFAREIEINNVPVFPDYVFKNDYSLKSIKELSEFIKQNEHLPGFEKGEHYEKHGINLNTMIIRQQEKIEELTLYIIQLSERLSKVENSK